jgi:hypothetical protein
MTMRVDIDHDVAPDDPYGNPMPPQWELLYADQACFAWTTAREEVMSNNQTIVLENLRVMLPKEVGVNERHRMNSICDRMDLVTFEGPFDIKSVEWKRDHWECALERASG